ncbi:MAG: hypothetical protein AB7V16_13450 [Vulcanibacillus sp.]
MDKFFEQGKKFTYLNNYKDAIKAFDKGAHHGEKSCQMVMVLAVQSLSERDRYNILKKAFNELNIDLEFNDFMNNNTGRFGNHYDDNTSKIIDFLLVQQNNIKSGKFLAIYAKEYEQFVLNAIKSQCNFIEKSLLGKHL